MRSETVSQPVVYMFATLTATPPVLHIYTYKNRFFNIIINIVEK